MKTKTTKPSEAQYTQGPWRVSGTRIVCARTATVVAETSSPCGYDPDGREQAANARLIAAAPQLLAVLEVLHAAWDHRRDGDGLQLAREAIKLAKGE